MVALLNPPIGVEVYQYRNEQDWLNGPRKRDITASKAAVLFDGTCLGLKKIAGLKHPYNRCEKVLSAVVDRRTSSKSKKKNGYLAAGADEEAAIIHRLWREHPEWTIRDLHGRGERIYLRDPSVRLGATLEPCVTIVDGELWVNEFKSASWKEFPRKRWDVRPPGWVIVQGNTAAGLAGARGCIFMCVQRSGFEPGASALHRIPFDKKLFRATRNRAAMRRFW